MLYKCAKSMARQITQEIQIASKHENRLTLTEARKMEIKATKI